MYIGVNQAQGRHNEVELVRTNRCLQESYPSFHSPLFNDFRNMRRGAFRLSLVLGKDFEGAVYSEHRHK
jgi:hypothetical protein